LLIAEQYNSIMIDFFRDYPKPDEIGADYYIYVRWKEYGINEIVMPTYTL